MKYFITLFIIALCLSSTVRAEEEAAPVCEVCKFVVHWAAGYVNNTREEIKGLLLKQCAKMPKGADKFCEAFVTLYADKLIDYIIMPGADPKKFCTEVIHACKPEEILEPESPICDVCQYAVKFVISYVNGSKEEILQKLNKACEKLPKGMDKICKTFVMMYGAELIEWVVEKGKDPHQFCHSIGLCGTEITAQEFYEKVAEGPACEICKLAVKTAVKYINGSADEILQKLEQACAKLPQGMDKICKTFVVIYGKQLIQWVIEKGEPGKFCAYVGLCKTCEEQEESEKPCELCLIIAKQFSKIINATDDQKIIEQMLEVCAKLPQGPDGICKTFVVVYGKELIKWVKEHAKDPKVLCTQLKLCKPEEVELYKDWKKVASCILKCLKGKYGFVKILQTVLKCTVNVACYGKTLGQDAAVCAAKCLA